MYSVWRHRDLALHLLTVAPSGQDMPSNRSPLRLVCASWAASSRVQACRSRSGTGGASQGGHAAALAAVAQVQYSLDRLYAQYGLRFQATDLPISQSGFWAGWPRVGRTHCSCRRSDTRDVARTSQLAFGRSCSCHKPQADLKAVYQDDKAPGVVEHCNLQKYRTRRAQLGAFDNNTPGWSQPSDRPSSVPHQPLPASQTRQRNQTDNL